MLIPTTRKAEWALLLSILFFSLIYWFSTTLPYFQKPMISTEDGYSRLASGVAWSSPTTRYPINYVWPPLTPIVYSLPYLIYPFHQYISVRILAWVLIFSTAIITGLIGYQLTKKIQIAIFSTSLALTNPLLINLSTQTLSENIWLPLVGLALYFLLSRHQSSWKYGIIFWSLSQAVRYESWYFTPLLVLIFWLYHRHRKGTVILALSSLLFPLYWYLKTSLTTHNFHFYLDEKLSQAKHGSPYIYHHLIPSITVWAIPLFQSISPPIIFLFTIGSRYFAKQKNYLYILPPVIVVSLIAQVYLATMEISPARYISLLPVLMIPVAVTALFTLSFSKKLTYTSLIAIVMLDVFSNPSRLCQLSDYLAPEQVEVGNYISNSLAPCISYIKSDLSPRFDNSAFWYLSRQPMTNIIFHRTKNPYQNTLHLRADCYTIVIEKTQEHPQPGETLPPAFGVPQFENYYFQVYEPPLLKERTTHEK